MRIVIDTNVLVSAIFFGGRPQEVVELAFRRQVTAVATPDIIAEYQATVHELEHKFSRRGTDQSLIRIISTFDVINASRTVKVCRDPDDDKFFACATEGSCIYIVSGDKDLLSVGHFEGVEVHTVADFLAQFRKNSK